VDVWSASLDPPASVLAPLHGHLSADERERAGRFVFARHRDRYVAGRAFLRLLLSQRLGEEPGELRFRYGPSGKPGLAQAHGDLEFNLAHAEAVVVCALAPRCGGIGVDVERVWPLSDVEAVARAAFSPREVARLQSLPEPTRLRGFYEAWTRKEAFLKALGCGLARPLDSFDVPAEAERFSLHGFEPDPDHVGAVAVAGHGWQVRHQRWRWAE
jgi:4'-phosphopantetheinyl transferase